MTSLLKYFNINTKDYFFNNTGIIYRNYSGILNLNEIIKIKKYCSKRNIKFYLSNNFKLALKLKLVCESFFTI